MNEALPELTGPGHTPNSKLPPIADGPRRKMLIEIEVTADFEKRLDNQWMVEREIHADRWRWSWADEEAKQTFIKMTGHAHFCHCGTASKPGFHLIGHCGCVRVMTAAPEPRPDDHWFVDGHEITDFTLRQQRGYHQHECGCWSRSPGSDNSIEA